MQQDDQQKNLLLAVALSAMVLLGWQLFFVSPKIKDEHARQQQQSQQTPSAHTPGAPTDTVPGKGPTVTPGGLPSGISGPVSMPREAATQWLTKYDSEHHVQSETSESRATDLKTRAVPEEHSLTHYIRKPSQPTLRIHICGVGSLLDFYPPLSPRPYD